MAAPDSEALAPIAHPKTAKTTAAGAARRVVLVIAFPSPSRQEAENAGQNQKSPKRGVEFAHSELST
jgi:hypothetical protein